jgi:hypothetical protein
MVMMIVLPVLLNDVVLLLLLLLARLKWKLLVVNDAIHLVMMILLPVFVNDVVFLLPLLLCRKIKKLLSLVRSWQSPALVRLISLADLKLFLVLLVETTLVLATKTRVIEWFFPCEEKQDD